MLVYIAKSLFSLAFKECMECKHAHVSQYKTQIPGRA